MALLVQIAAGVAVLIAAIVARGTWEERRRRRDHAAYCRARGYEYVEVTTREWRPHQATNVLFEESEIDVCGWGPAIKGTCNGVAFTAFECSWFRMGSGSQGIGAVLWTTERTLPRFLMTVAGFWTGDVGTRANYEGGTVKFEDSPDFSRRYRVQGDDIGAVRALFTRELRDALSLDTHHRVAGCGKELIWWQGRNVLPQGEALDQFLMEGNRLRTLFDRS